VDACPEIFRVSGGRAYAIVRRPRSDSHLEAKLRQAAQECPEKAISLTVEAGSRPVGAAKEGDGGRRSPSAPEGLIRTRTAELLEHDGADDEMLPVEEHTVLRDDLADRHRQEQRPARKPGQREPDQGRTMMPDREEDRRLREAIESHSAFWDALIEQRREERRQEFRVRRQGAVGHEEEVAGFNDLRVSEDRSEGTASDQPGCRTFVPTEHRLGRGEARTPILKLRGLDEYRQLVASRYGESLRATIVHEHAWAKTTQYREGWSSTTRKSTWIMSQPAAFHWVIERPETDSKVFSMTCPCCKSIVEMRVWSLDSMARRLRSRAPVGLTVMMLLFGTLIGAYLSSRDPGAPVFLLSLIFVWPWALFATLVYVLGDPEREVAIKRTDYWDDTGLRTHPMSDSLTVYAPDEITHHCLLHVEYVHDGRQWGAGQARAYRW
jgi:hypothetical protein